MTSEKLLLRLAAEGDEDAFLSIYTARKGPLYGFVLKLTGSPWAAEEIVQDAFMTLLSKAESFDTECGTLSALLYGIARNCVRRYNERHFHRLEVPLDVNPSAWCQHDRKLQTEEVMAAVSELPEDFRQAIQFCHLEELTYYQAAERMGCPIGTVRSRLHRAKAMLISRLN